MTPVPGVAHAVNRPTAATPSTPPNPSPVVSAGLSASLRRRADRRIFAVLWIAAGATGRRADDSVLWRDATSLAGRDQAGFRRPGIVPLVRDLGPGRGVLPPWAGLDSADLAPETAPPKGEC